MSLPAPPAAVALDRGRVVRDITRWYAAHARDLPWRVEDVTPWGVLVSEYMLQQTPVTRVLPYYEQWLRRWPTAPDLAAEPVGEAVRAWGRLGYPRRAQRLWQAATILRDRFEGDVPADLAELRALPGVGDYTAAAIASFAHGRRHVVLDTNVRRVLGRLEQGRALPPPGISRIERLRAEAWLPAEESAAARWAVASMELGARVCLATGRPLCERCPVRADCRWAADGFPTEASPRRSQPYAGTDRQCRGALLAALRATEDPVDAEALLRLWPGDPTQARRALRSLLDDGLVRLDDDRFRL